jgi:hypothetical protein
VRNLKFDRFDVTAVTGPAVPLKRAESSSWETKNKVDSVVKSL